MTLALLGQYVMNGVMLGMMYALVAVGFTLFFGVLDIIQFSHGDVLAFGAFVALAVWAALVKLGVAWPAVQLVAVVVFSALATAAVGALVARFVVLPLKGAPSLNVLLVTLMMGTVLREAIRLFYPGGSQPQRFSSPAPICSSRARASGSPSARWRRTRRRRAPWASTSAPWCSSPSASARRWPRSPAQWTDFITTRCTTGWACSSA